MENSLAFFAIILFVYLWAGTYTFLYKHTTIKKRIRFKVSSLGIPIEYAFSTFITVYYLGFATLGILLAAAYTDGSFWSIFELNISFENLAVIFLGIVAAFSLSYFLSYIFSFIKTCSGSTKQTDEIRWIKGIQRFPKWLAILVTVTSSFVEEIFFRGVVIFITVNECGFSYLTAGIFSFALFSYAQIKYTDNLKQAAIILNSCIVITLVSTAMITVSSSIIPSMIMHGSFVSFYTFSGSTKYKTHIAVGG